MGDKGEDDVSLRVSLKFFNSDMRLLVPFKIRWHVTLRVSLKFNISLIFIYIYIYGLLSKIKWRVTLRVSLKLVLRNPPRKPPTRYFMEAYALLVKLVLRNPPRKPPTHSFSIAYTISYVKLVLRNPPRKPHFYNIHNFLCQTSAA